MIRRLVLRAAVVVAALPALATAQSRPAAPAPKATAAPAGELPTAQAIIARYVQAIGGRDAILKRSALHMTGTFEMPASGIKGDIEAYSAAPNKMVMSMNLPGLGQVRSGFDGSVAWAVNPATGPRLLEGKELAQTKNGSNFYRELYDAAGFSTMQTVGRTDFEGTPAYKVLLVRQEADSSYEYFDVSTGLRLGDESTQDSPMGRMTIVSVLSDYKAFDGVLAATRRVQRVGPQELIFTISTLGPEGVTPAVFELPAEIKALQKP